MSQQNPHAEALQGILTSEVGRRLFSSFSVFNNKYFAEEDSLKASSALTMLNEKVFPDVILSEIPQGEKKEMLLKALEVNIGNLKASYEALIDFVLQKQVYHPTMAKLQVHLKTIAPQKDKK